MNQQLSTEDNLANQRKFASEFVRDYPNPELESIRFTTEGYVDGAGAWGASAVLTVAGNEYKGMLGNLSGGDPLPTISPGSKAADVTVIYSDETREVLK